MTEQWATVALVGPGSRGVLARVAPDLAVDAESFPFMRWRDADGCRVAGAGLPDQLLRRAGLRDQRAGLARARAVARPDAAGAEDGITPYGTETMHVLRAEKGYPIVGQDTDGTVTAGRPGPRLGDPKIHKGLRRPAVAVADRHRPGRTASSSSACCRTIRRCCWSRARTSSSTRRSARHPCRTSVTSRPATAAWRWAGRSRSPWSRPAGAA